LQPEQLVSFVFVRPHIRNNPCKKESRISRKCGDPHGLTSLEGGTMEARMHRLALATASLLAAQTMAHAQDPCLFSIKVNATKNVAYLNLGAAPGESISLTMSCTSAENMRQRMFLSGEALQPALLNDASALRARLREINEQLAEKQVALAAAQNRAQRELILNSLGSIALAGGAAFGTAGCIAGGLPACVGAFGAAVGLVKLVEAAATSASDLAKEAQAASAEIARILNQSRAIEAQINRTATAQYKQRYNKTSTALCNAIRQQCLP
jgi:hypothetical protein